MNKFFKRSSTAYTHITLLCLRGTKDFQIDVSKDNAKWTTVVTDTLPDVSALDCGDYTSNPFFLSTGPLFVRYVRFRALSYHSDGAGLQYFKAAFKGFDGEEHALRSLNNE